MVVVSTLFNASQTKASLAPVIYAVVIITSKFKLLFEKILNDWVSKIYKIIKYIYKFLNR